MLQMKRGRTRIYCGGLFFRCFRINFNPAIRLRYARKRDSRKPLRKQGPRESEPDNRHKVTDVNGLSGIQTGICRTAA